MVNCNPGSDSSNASPEARAFPNYQPVSQEDFFYCFTVAFQKVRMKQIGVLQDFLSAWKILEQQQKSILEHHEYKINLPSPF